MPLRAQLDGRSINAALLPEVEWQALKGSPLLRMPCCDAFAYRRTSRLGTRHFVHSSKNHCGAEGERQEHLAAKAEIVRVCCDLGWEADSEVAGGKWRADVLATRDRHRVAFEIQWSNQTLEITRERQAEYGADVKCCWLFRKIPLSRGEPVIERNLPMFSLQLGDSGFQVTVGHKVMSLRDFVTARLSRQIRFCDQTHYSECDLQVMARETACWRCGGAYDVFCIRRVLRSNCRAETTVLYLDDAPTGSGDPYSARRNYQFATRHFASELKRLRVSLGWRWSSTVERSYWSFGCPSCNAIFGNHYFGFLEYEALGEVLEPFCSKKVACSQAQPEPHWCLPQNGGFCT
jgi:hypothetical protein